MPISPDSIASRALPAIMALGGTRKLIAVAGPPGSGKSTLADALSAALADAGQSAQVVPMDGFHLDNRILEARGLLTRKGCPESFDADGFLALVRRIAAGESVAYPVFDRALDVAIAGAALLVPATEYVIFEGNYLLLDMPPWRDLRAYWSFALALEEPRAELERRLVDRWLRHGLSRAEAIRRCAENDMVNADLVLEGSGMADLVVTGGA